MPIPLLLAAAAAPAIIKGITGIVQLNKKVDKVDTTPPAFKEQLAALRLAQNAQMPGYGMISNRLAQGQSAALQSARLGAASSSDFLASAGAAAARRQQGEQQLGVQQQQYRDRATQQLNQGLQQQAQYQQADDRAYNQTKAALTGSGMSNLYGGISDLASVGAYGLSNAGGAAGATPQAGAGSDMYGSGAYDGMYDTGGYNPYRNPRAGYGRISNRIF